MGNYLSASQAAIVDRDNRNMAASGQPMSGIINDIFADIDAGTIGITSNAADVDSLALGGGCFTWDQNTAPPSTSLLFAWLGGRFHNGFNLVTVAPGSVTLAASATNYVELDRSGTVYAQTTGWTAGRMPLYMITTGASSYTAAQVVSYKALLTLLGPASVNGAMLSTAASTKEVSAQLGTISATTSFLILAPNVAATLAAVRFVNSTAFALSGTNYWTWSITDLGTAGTGTAQLLNTGVSSSTNTGGTALSANVPQALPLNGTPTTAAGDVLQLTFTKTGTPANLTLASIELDFVFAA